MKTYYLHSIMLVVSLVISLSISAQITITSEDLVREGNYTSQFTSVANSSIDIPTGGENQLWDYSNIIPGTTSELVYFDATGSADFPDASIYRNRQRQFEVLNVNYQLYETVTEDGWYNLGTVVPYQSNDISALSGSAGDKLEFGGVRRYETPNLLIDLPMTYPDQFSNTYVETLDYQLTAAGFGLNQVPGRRIITNSSDNEVIGYGQLVIPDINGLPSAPMDVLLIKRVNTSVDSTTLAGAAAPQALLDVFNITQNYTYSSSQYYFLRKGYNTTVLSVSVSGAGVTAMYRPQAVQSSSVIITNEDIDRSGNYIDTLINVNETEVDFPSHGEGQLWDYSHLTPKELAIKEHFDATEIEAFPDATGYYNNNLNFQSFVIPTDTYERVDENSWTILGRQVAESTFSITPISGGAEDNIKFLQGDYLDEGNNDILKFPVTFEKEWSTISKRNLDFELSVSAFGLTDTPGKRVRITTDTVKVVGSGKVLLPSTNGSASTPIEALLLTYKTTVIDSFYLGGAPAPSSLLDPFGLVQGASSEINHYTFFATGYNSAVLFIPIDFNLPVSYRLKGFELESQKIIYVNQSATGNGDGRSWENAYTNLSNALADYNKDDEIWVAQGTYTPSVVAGLPDNKRSFYIDKDVSIYGGFIGDESNREDRDPLNNKTILSGDIMGDDVADNIFLNKTDNANNVVFVTVSTTAATTIDGFVITGGYADGNPDVFSDLRGAGLWSVGPVVVNNCHFNNNYATNHGGGLYFYRINAPGSAITNSTFESNVVNQNGGGVVLAENGSDPIKIDNCKFVNNTSGDAGGGIISIRSIPVITNSLFEGNSSITSGGGLDISQGLDFYYAIVDNCIIRGNQSTSGGGIEASMFGANNSIEITNCEIVENVTDFFDQNNPDYGGSGIRLFTNYINNKFVIDNCNISNNTTTNYGSGIGIFDFTLAGANEFLITNCRLDSNHADGDYGAIGVANEDEFMDLKIINTSFTNNTAASVNGFFIGSSLFNPDIDADVKLINCLFANNNNPQGFLIGFQDHDVDLISNTIADNESIAVGIFNNASAIIRNNIIQSGIYPNFVDSSNLDEPIRSFGSNLLSDNTIASWALGTDQNTTDALFETGTYQLSENSTAIDAGVLDDELPSNDIAGNDRIQGGCVDIGAYESMHDSGGSCITSVEQLYLPNGSVSIFPNPTTSHINISSEEVWDTDITIQIFNSMGQLIQSSIITEENKKTLVLEVSDLNNGHYLVKMSDKYKIAVSSFVKN